MYTSRFRPFGVLLSLSLSLVVAACGSNPEVPNDGQPIVVIVDGGSGTTPDSGGPMLNVDAGNAPDGSGMSEAGASGEDAGPVCGDSVIDSPETCDDGNSVPGDGCDGNCQLEPNFVCPKAGEPCTPSTTPAVCGNGQLEAGETCDLGSDKNDGSEGCDSTCQTVNGWTCPADGSACTRNAYCGDGIVQSTLGEQCDDGTNDGTKGCSSTCQTMTGYNCPPTGGACSVAAYCGNGTLDPGEQCDDHNRRNYDGCSATCLIETGFSCPPAGGACVRLCGNSVINTGETCDDGNFLSGDGCSSLCKLEANYTCSTVGQPCIFTPPPPPAVCGNGVLETGEGCDDGNANGGDGCSSSCKVESGWACASPNNPCTAARCGDGILAGAEQCDDGFVDNVHGCSSTCTIEPGATCPANGGLCVPMKCGDGKVTGTETCDDGVNNGLHGCSATCQIIAGWACPLAGTACVPVCGDGIVAGDEQCDEKGDAPCCTTACKLKPGYVCDPSKTPHSQTASPYCGNGTVDGTASTSTVRGPEQCDDGNTVPFDGCSPTCTNEPLCGTVNTYLPLAQQATVAYQCFAHCGDGIILSPEQCDDGNTLDGDGCDHNCNVEKNPATGNPAWTCTQAASSNLSIPVIWRDFAPSTHPQFSINPQVGRRLPGITQNTLAQVSVTGGVRPYKYVPAYNPSFASPTFGGSFTGVANWTMNGPGWVSGTDAILNAQNAATLVATNANALLTFNGRFQQWYTDDSTVNKTYTGTLPLTTLSTGALQYSCTAGTNACDGQPTAVDGFFPLDGKGWVASGQETARAGGSGALHNFSFTTEARYWFAFGGGENLAFYGDDDVWVFVNGTLALDIGGIHGQTAGNFTLGADGNATSCAQNLANGTAGDTVCSTVNLGLVVGTVYEVAVFNAERHVSGSNFQLTLKGFNSSPSVCTPICGDGYVVGTEQCDRGTGNVAPTGNTYGMCTTACQLGPYCGDAKLTNPPELCDNGLNIDAYVNHSPSAQMCAPGCVEPVYCGDGIIQKVDGEECDDAGANQNTYGHCQTNCHLGARCGDGQRDANEACDDGANNGAISSLCTATCTLKCGNNVVDSGEDCDDGVNNGTATSNCDTSCHLKCGNGQLDPGEACDDGKNDGSYGTCNPITCTLAPYCGDGIVQNPPEACDNGTTGANANKAGAWGVGSCTDQCLPGGFCGDGLINGAEKCDDGQNTGKAGSCMPNCSAYVPPVTCGDGVLQTGEKCDDGAKNGTTGDRCDKQCRLTCGNGVVDPGEQCDNGINDGSYGTCTSACKLAGYCGDGIKNGNEQCDKGSANVAPKTAYGTGVCTTACLAAPFCGDGRVQSKFGEECEGNDMCSACQTTTVQ